MPGSSFSTNNSTGRSTSTSNPIQTPQSEWGLQLSQLLNALGNNQYQWAMDQFNTGKDITNDNIHQYMDLAGKGSGLADQLITQYQDQFKPLMDEYIRQAGTFNSEGRQRFMMGQAESTVAQADQKARDEAERKLQGFGINPNSGRYQDLMLTSRIQDAAARAGAGTQAALDTADRGRAMTEKAAAMGQNIPGMAVNALQSAYTGVTGAENAILGMINTGTNATGSAAPFFNTSSGAIKNPSQGTQAQSAQNAAGLSRSSTSDPSKSSSDKGGGGRQPSENSGNTPHQGSSPDANRVITPKQMTNPYQPGAGVKKKDDSDNNGEIPAEPMPYFDEHGNFTPFADPQFARDPSGQMYTPETTPWNDLPQAPNWAPQQQDFNPVMNPQGSSPYNVDPGANAPNAWTPESPTSPQPANQQDPFGGQDFSSPQQAQPTSGDFGGGYWQPPQQDQQPTQQPEQPPFDDSQVWGPSDNYQPDNGTQDFSPSPDNSGGQSQNYDDNSNSDYTDESYARGGSVRAGVLPTTGGHVSRGASPSRGRVTDDVPARLNAGEFVVPRDVVAHKGSEFFQNLIAKSRKVRTGMSGAPARGKMKPALPNMHRPRFVSQQMGAQR